MLKSFFTAVLALLALRGLVSLLSELLVFCLRPRKGRARLVFDCEGVKDPETEVRRLLSELRLLGLLGRVPVRVVNAPQGAGAAFSMEKNLRFVPPSPENGTQNPVYS